MRRCSLKFFVTVFSISLIYSFTNTSYIYAGELRGEAESYRAKGYEAQERGDIESAITWYTKAVNLDPDFASPYNDLGILYEARGLLDRAESNYQRALAVDPDYEKAHTNLALLYERKGELERAAFHWMRRYNLGKPGDPWTSEAKGRLLKLGLVEEDAEVKTEALPATKEPPKPKAKSKEDRPGKKARKEPKKEGSRKKTEKTTETKRAAAERTLLERDVKKKASKPGEEKPKKKEKAQKKEKKEKSSQEKKRAGWTKLIFGSKKDKGAAKAPHKPVAAETKDKDMENKLQESLKLAEERLRKEKAGKAVPVTKELKKTPDSGADRYYQEAQNYYKKGEYSRGLDVLRAAKKEHPDDPGLLDLEQSIKNRMKEERIEDHYEEGITLYRQKKFSGARKEFEAILNILPE